MIKFAPVLQTLRMRLVQPRVRTRGATRAGLVLLTVFFLLAAVPSSSVVGGRERTTAAPVVATASGRCASLVLRGGAEFPPRVGMLGSPPPDDLEVLHPSIMSAVQARYTCTASVIV